MKNDFCINPALLKWARETIGLSVEMAAKKINVDSDVLKKWEEGIIETPTKKIKKLSEVYKRPTTVFLMNNIPDENISKKFRQLLYSNINSFSTPTLMAIRKAIRIQTLAKDILETNDNNFIKEISKLKLIDSYEKISEKLIESLGLNEDIISKPKNVFEQLNMWKNSIEAKGIYILEVGFPVSEAKGFAIYDKKVPVIVLNTNDYPHSRIFTLLHELSHFIYGEDAIDDEYSLMNFSTDDKLEIKCNYLAGSILVPSLYLKNKITFLNLNIKNDINTTLEVLARIFNVSQQVILRRIFISDYLNKDQFNSINYDLRESFLHSEVREKKTGGNFYIKFLKNNSRSFIYDVLEAYRINKISHFDVMDYLNLKSSTLASLENRL
ncbi:hypothetical protein COY13_02520 [Candidatus Roizmanbacteria bacterium CG_4_10_14_0_2_um_filter_36_35]|uniref:HTH cro/C1-type domain-containing protein n=5 Tax=Candidatus Roizmaniibacteriota TaxID=1752723 RepID=A0A2M7BXU9_9BACT|nr:MAG: hypothetical protein COX47_03845 [Candidatus Roizmanbacteria bacterium CG23_combo_of_CG06-09_8_20_14_all_35_49]PIQ72585.1 MAG: hypothetical protein COV86_02245 [Candidatus Roizmanbacteria bacterium CG11_big_fil_rev_8_21_14_0_20_35_14]PIV11392.1 MAG: hypothetical protein COS50_00450 [Candidatus Roizmanbacteria bacterium CG03_land_8_20_14_0_80_35_26]PIZ67765.1 MAG: hypothetical protein COY13_02520 [Candidatus Roizmanbacteria bacterium CG_4_10_14_0_2_um_filter_36_35]PJC33202.1 MAG: hypothe